MKTMMASRRAAAILPRHGRRRWLQRRAVSENAGRLQALQFAGGQAEFAEDFFRVLAAARGGAHDAAWRSFKLHRLPDHALAAKVLRLDFLDHLKMLDLRLFEYCPHIVDVAAGDAAGI